MLIKDLKNEINNHSEQLAERTYFLTPEMYGAVGDGITNDSQAIINVTIEANLQRKAVLFTQNYAINGGTSIEFANLDYVHWIGINGAEITSTVKTASGHLIRFNHCNHLTIDNVAWSNSETDITSKENNLAIFNANYVEIRNCHFKQSYNKHIHLQGVCKKVKIDNCIFEKGLINHNADSQSFIFGVFFIYDDDTNPTLIDDIEIINCNFTDNGYACITFAPDSARGILIANFTIRNNKFSHSVLVARFKGIKNLYIEDNKIVNVGTQVLKDYYTYYTELGYYSKVREQLGGVPQVNTCMTIQSGYASAIYLMSNLENVYIKDNKFNGLYDLNGDTNGYGVKIDKCTNLRFINNDINEIDSIATTSVVSFFSITEFTPQIIFKVSIEGNVVTFKDGITFNKLYPVFNFPILDIGNLYMNDNIILGNVSQRYLALEGMSVVRNKDLVLQNSWTTANAVKVYKKGNLAMLTGSITGGVTSSGTIIGTVGSDFCPDSGFDLSFPVMCTDGTTFATGYVRMTGTGQLKVYSLPVIANMTVHLNGITWLS